MRRVKDMTDEELNQKFEREYKETWLRRNRSRKILAWICIICLLPILLLIVCGFIVPMFILMLGMA